MLRRHKTRKASGKIGAKYQAGLTLMETLVALAISLIVTTSMVSLMGNSMGTTTRLLHMTQLTNELRNTMSLVSRDVRRANYNPYSFYCYANSDCGIGDSMASYTADLDTPAFNGADDACLVYFLERETPTGATSSGNTGGGGFRLNTSNGNGVIEMWTGGNNQPPPVDCSGNSWVEVTDPGIVDITAFTIDDSESFTGSITGSGGVEVTQRTRQIRLQIDGELVRDRSISRSVQDTIRVRNEHISLAST